MSEQENSEAKSMDCNEGDAEQVEQGGAPSSACDHQSPPPLEQPQHALLQVDSLQV